jgi:hypothetical protein
MFFLATVCTYKFKKVDIVQHCTHFHKSANLDYTLVLILLELFFLRCHAQFCDIIKSQVGLVCKTPRKI